MHFKQKHLLLFQVHSTRDTTTGTLGRGSRVEKQENTPQNWLENKNPIFFLQDGVGETAFSSESFNTYKLLLYWLKKNLDTIFFVVFSWTMCLPVSKEKAYRFMPFTCNSVGGIFFLSFWDYIPHSSCKVTQTKSEVTFFSYLEVTKATGLLSFN